LSVNILAVAKFNMSYHDTGASCYNQQYQQRRLKQLQKQAVALGFDLIARPPSTPLVEDVF
jgi:hypothetical protein